MLCAREFVVVELIIGEIVSGVNAWSSSAGALDLFIERDLISIPMDTEINEAGVHRFLVLTNNAVGISAICG